ncbi:MAG TPA: hypothetical protein PKD64_08960 [Pirellulaceae bacterium]|nr:hypothetical protein [Pirellulaceae bacterium]HMO92316.1 hypothetical protein [Pirellulaceae bacterium]HMP69240.1 hypothetical protein [Pirellulaceae bacterium]
MLINRICCVLCLVVYSLSFVAAQDDSAKIKGDPLAGIKCAVDGDRNASLDHSANYHDALVFFCCNGCKSKFMEDDSAFATKANHQLVLTGQYNQTACPITGQALLEETKTNFAGAEIGFCCNRCKGSFQNAASYEDKAEMVFGKQVFTKAFGPTISLEHATCPISDQKVSQQHLSEYRNGVVYFCCGGCKKKFDENRNEFSTAANYQLVATGQYVQAHCPFSGGDFNELQSFKLKQVDVSFCCGSCKGKVANADDDGKRLEMLFSDKPFEQGFVSKSSK